MVLSMKKKWQFLISSWLWLVSSAQGEGITFPMRLIYLEQNQQGIVATISNSTQQVYLLQSWLDDLDRQDGPRQSKRQIPFVITPPLFRLDAGQSQVIRIRKLVSSLPSDRESVFFLATKLIPNQIAEKTPLNQQSSMRLQMVTLYRIKLFYRPKGLVAEGAVEQAIKTVQVIKKARQLIIYNPSAYYLTFSQIKLGQQLVAASQLMQMVAPYSKTAYDLTQATTANSVTLVAIDEHGQATSTTVKLSE